MEAERSRGSLPRLRNPRQGPLKHAHTFGHFVYADLVCTNQECRAE